MDLTPQKLRYCCNVIITTLQFRTQLNRLGEMGSTSGLTYSNFNLLPLKNHRSLFKCRRRLLHSNSNSNSNSNPNHPISIYINQRRPKFNVLNRKECKKLSRLVCFAVEEEEEDVTTTDKQPLGGGGGGGGVAAIAPAAVQLRPGIKHETLSLYCIPTFA